MEKLWALVKGLGPLVVQMANIEESLGDVMEMVSRVEEREMDMALEDEAVDLGREVGAGRGEDSPVAQYHNGHLVNRVDFGGAQR